MQRSLSERPRVDFLAQIEKTMECQQASILSMEIVPAALPKRIARVLVRGCKLFWGVIACLAEYSLRRLGGRLNQRSGLKCSIAGRAGLFREWAPALRSRVHFPARG